MADDMPISDLFELISYDKSTGEFFWNHRSLKWFDSDRIYKCWNSRWAGKPAMNAIDSHGYNISHVAKYRVCAHRAVWAFHYGDWPDGAIDHINGIKSDNRIENLRLATVSQNQHNRGLQVNNTSGYKGVSFHKQTGKWRSVIWKGGKRLSLGLYFDPKDAHLAYSCACVRYHGEFGNDGNGPVLVAT